MYIERIVIKNIRCFEDVDLKLSPTGGSLAGWIVLAGRNSAGKTTLLQAIALAAKGNWNLSGEGLIRTGQPSGEVEITLCPGRKDYPHEPGLRTIRFEQPDRVLEGNHLNTKFRSVWDNFPKLEYSDGWFLAAYGSMRRLTGHSLDAAELMSNASPFASIATLCREDATLAESVHWLREVYLRRLEGDEKSGLLEQAALTLLGCGLLPDEFQIIKIDSSGLWIRHGQEMLALNQLGDGYRNVTALVLDILRNLYLTFGELDLVERDGNFVIPYDGVILIDEADAHLHISWQKRIGFWLKQHFPNIQFIVSTHSPYICQAANPGGLIRLPAPGESGSVEPLPDALYTTVVNGSSDEAVMSNLFGLEYPHSEKAESIREALAHLEFKSMRGQLSEREQLHLHELSEQMPQSPESNVERALRRLKSV